MPRTLGPRLRVLLIPDSIYWVTGTIAKSIARFNPWIEATVVSGPVISDIFPRHPELMHNFDLVHFTCPYASFNWLPRFRDLVPCVTSHHHVSDWQLLKHNLEGDAIIVGSQEWVTDLESRGADLAKVFCVPYGVDADLFLPQTPAARARVRAKLRLPKDSVVVGFFGKNSSNEGDRKGIDVFKSAIVSLNGRIANLEVLIVGPGWAELVESFKQINVRCTWLPFITDLEGLAEMYQALDFYWVTARVEGGPVTLLEAMSSEICCLTTAVGLARQIVRDGENAVLLPFADSHAFVERTVALAGAPEERLRIGRNARQTIVKEMHIGVTTPLVRNAYIKAFENFAKRTARPATVDLTDLNSDNGSVTAPTQTDLLSGFPSGMRRHIHMLESLAWGEHLVLYQRQWATGMRIMMREWFRNPTSSRPLRMMLRTQLPGAIVTKTVELKKLISRSSNSVVEATRP